MPAKLYVALSLISMRPGVGLLTFSERWNMVPHPICSRKKRVFSIPWSKGQMTRNTYMKWQSASAQCKLVSVIMTQSIYCDQGRDEASNKGSKRDVNQEELNTE